MSLLCSYTWWILLFIKSPVHVNYSMWFRIHFNCWFSELTSNKKRNLKKVAFYLYCRICWRDLGLCKNCLYRVLEWNSAAKSWATERCSDWICIQWPHLTVGICRCNIYEIRLPPIVCKQLRINNTVIVRLLVRVKIVAEKIDLKAEND